MHYGGITGDAPVAFIGTDRWHLPDFDEEFLRAITAEAIKRRWQLVELDLFDGRPPEGITLDGIFIRSIPGTERVEQLKEYASHLIRIGSAPHPDDRLLPAVLPDLIAQGRLAADHFAERGFAHLGFVGRKPWSLWENLYIGIQKGAEEKGMKVELLSLPAFLPSGKSTSTPAYERFTDWILKAPKPLALICSSDGFAARFCAWSRSVGVRVPTDVAILGRGNATSFCERCLPRLSSINNFEYDRGIAACELMESMLAGKKPPRKPIMIAPSGITVRESTDVLASVDRTVAEALHFMWQNIGRDLSVDDIAKKVGVHRRMLERAFQNELGRGVNAELRRRRLEKSCELLEKTDMRVADVGHSVGFRAEDYFYRAFKRAFHSTPLRWRKTHQ